MKDSLEPAPDRKCEGIIPALPLRVVQVNTRDREGGAARIAWSLHEAYRFLGWQSWMAVGIAERGDPGVVTIPKELDGSLVKPKALRLVRALQSPKKGGLLPGAWRLGEVLQGILDPERAEDVRGGLEDFHYPGTWGLLDLVPCRPDVIHCHNLHGGYFDLRALPWLSRVVPLVLTLHDAWLLSGHCAHSFQCERWRYGCGQCPSLNAYSSIRRDATALNWMRKKAIFSRCRLHIATPCQWLMERVSASTLMDGAAECRVIPNGVDLSVFSPGPKEAARRRLGIRHEARVLLMAANRIRGNICKDYGTLCSALKRLDQKGDIRPTLFLGVGEEAPSQRLGEVQVQFVPFVKRSEDLALYYRAADLYVHASKVDTFPTSVLEALACGIPAVATAVGGIPEQVKGLTGLLEDAEGGTLNTWGSEQATGLLVPPHQPEVLASGIRLLLAAGDLRGRLGENAARDARDRFGLERQVDAYGRWYREILSKRQTDGSTGSRSGDEGG